MTGTRRKLARAAALSAAALAIWAFGGDGFRAAIRAAFPAAPALSGETLAGDAPALPEIQPAAATASPGASVAGCAIVRVVDGDTVRARCGDGPEEPVRLVGVDAPEVARQGKPAECGASLATEALVAALAGGSVFLTPDPEQPDRDRYGRLLRFLATSSPSSGEDAPWEGSVNLWLVQSGVGYAYRDLRYGGEEAFAAAERAASLAALGLWASCPGR